MTTKCPHAKWDPLGDPESTPLMARHDIIGLHTMAGPFSVVDEMFHADGYGGTESHFGVAGSGFAKQWQDLERRADANNEGNHRVISIETADMGEDFPAWGGSDVPKWTPEQIVKIVEIVAWCCDRYDIPPVLIPDSQSHRRGIGYHRQGIDGNFPPPYEGRQGVGEKWSTTTGKPCPGDKRITQLIEIIIPRVKLVLNPPPPDKDFLVVCYKNGKKIHDKVFEQARRPMLTYAREHVLKEHAVRIRKVKDQD